MKTLGVFFFLVFFAFAGAQAQTILLPSYGETGWQTYSHTYTETDPWSGTVNIGVSDTYDTVVPSFLLLDNFTGVNFSGNEGFENGDFTGVTLSGVATVGSSATSSWGTVFSPTEGSLMAILDSVDGNSGASTASLGVLSATDGSWLSFPLTLNMGDTVTFDWNFFTYDYWDLEDFAFLHVTGVTGGTDDLEILAKIAFDGDGESTVPEPTTLFLLGSGLLGLAGIGKERRKV